ERLVDKPLSYARLYPSLRFSHVVALWEEPSEEPLREGGRFNPAGVFSPWKQWNDDVASSSSSSFSSSSSTTTGVIDLTSDPVDLPSPSTTSTRQHGEASGRSGRWAWSSVKDVTRRYAGRWSESLALRLPSESDTWWTQTLSEISRTSSHMRVSVAILL